MQWRWQLQTTGEPWKPGLGEVLGLAITHEIVTRQQGQVNYYRLQAGSLEFRLPLRSSRLKGMRLKAVVCTTTRLRRAKEFTDNQ